MKNSNIRPTGRKGRENIDRMRELMKITPIKEGVDRSTDIITKLGPDGKAYAIIKENSEYYIKVANKTSGLVKEDFNYIGGLMNKKNEAYHSYSEATKQLNMKFINLAESAEQKIFNILRNDNLLNEGEDINGKEAPVDKKTSGDNVADGDNIGVDDFEDDKADGTKDGNTGTHAEKHVMETVELTENEKYFDNIIKPNTHQVKKTKNKGISIGFAMNRMDSIIDEVTGESDNVNALLEGLTDSELNILKKKLLTSDKKKV